MEKLKQQLKKLNISESSYEFYGRKIAKINFRDFKDNPRKGKLILMTSINPTSAGEGKTTTAIGLADGLNYIGKRAVLALREPSLGPVFGRKGTATGGGLSEVEPMADINLHFTGDFHAITSANNMISAALDSSIYWGNEFKIDLNNIVWKRCLDLNDRSLREVEIKITKSISRKEQFTITAASNMMTIISLAKDENDLRERIDKAIVAYDVDQNPILVKQLGVTGSVMVLLKEAIKPNFVLTKYDSPTFIHCGPFANIATGTNSIISTDLALKLGDFAIVESGFGSDLGFEKFMNVINYSNNLVPDVVVMVVTLRALNLHKDFDNNFRHLEMHLNHAKEFNLNQVVAINYIEGDDQNQLKQLQNWLDENQYNWEMNEAYTKGAEGAKNLANKVVEISNIKTNFKPMFVGNETIKEKINKVSKKIYFQESVLFSERAEDSINKIEKENKYADLPICIVKSSNSIDGNDKGVENYALNISDVSINSGAEFILVYTNSVMSMPGLGKDANFKTIDLIDDEVFGLK